MSFTQYLLVVLLSLPGAYHDTETWQERSARMETVARAVDVASSRATCSAAYNVPECNRQWLGSKKDLALLLVTKGWWESRFAQNVHEGRCRPFECDAIKINGVIVHLARTPWQLQKTSFVRLGEWDDMVGTDFNATSTAAWVAIRVMASSYRRCRGIPGAISGYASARCDWPGAGRRYLFWQRLMNKTNDQLTADVETRRREHEERDVRHSQATASR